MSSSIVVDSLFASASVEASLFAIITEVLVSAISSVASATTVSSTTTSEATAASVASSATSFEVAGLFVFVNESVSVHILLLVALIAVILPAISAVEVFVVRAVISLLFSILPI